MAENGSLLRYILTDTKQLVQSILESVESDNEYSVNVLNRGEL